MGAWGRVRGATRKWTLHDMHHCAEPCNLPHPLCSPSQTSSSTLCAALNAQTLHMSESRGSNPERMSRRGSGGQCAVRRHRLTVGRDLAGQRTKP